MIRYVGRWMVIKMAWQSLKPDPEYLTGLKKQSTARTSSWAEQCGNEVSARGW